MVSSARRNRWPKRLEIRTEIMEPELKNDVVVQSSVIISSYLIDDGPKYSHPNQISLSNVSIHQNACHSTLTGGRPW